MSVFLLPLVFILSLPRHSAANYCVCNSGLSDAALQKSIDYACGAGADCSQIQPNGPCFNPNTVKDHCNYAVNSYYQKKGNAPGSCDFGGTASVSPNPPSVSSGCVYPSSPGNAGGATPATPTPPAGGAPATPTPPAGGAPATPTPPAGGAPATPTPPAGGAPATPTPPAGGAPATPTPPAGGAPTTPAPPTGGTPITPTPTGGTPTPPASPNTGGGATFPGSGSTAPGFGPAPTLNGGFGNTDGDVKLAALSKSSMIVVFAAALLYI